MTEHRRAPSPGTTPTYPPEPWDLSGSGQITVWGVAASDLPALPSGVRPATLAGRAVACTAFVDYGEGSMLAYHELLAAVVVREGRGLALCITDIWVDSPASRAGGRELWGIPKELADFSMSPGQSWASRADAPLADAWFRSSSLPAVPLPVLRGRIVQERAGELLRTPLRTGGRVRPARARWDFAPGGPLCWLAGARPLASVRAEHFAMRFGR
ncbi:MAG: acetoacetate decarboxylase family protein [Marmoricola sp.]